MHVCGGEEVSATVQLCNPYPPPEGNIFSSRGRKKNLAREFDARANAPAKRAPKNYPTHEI